MQEIYTSEQVAKILQIHPQTVLKFIREGRLKGSKVGRGYRIKASDVEEFLERTASQRPKNQEIKNKEIQGNTSNEPPNDFSVQVETHYII